jgi:hypothetical protein
VKGTSLLAQAPRNWELGPSRIAECRLCREIVGPPLLRRCRSVYDIFRKALKRLNNFAVDAEMQRRSAGFSIDQYLGGVTEGLLYREHCSVFPAWLCYPRCSGVSPLL